MNFMIPEAQPIAKTYSMRVSQLNRLIDLSQRLGKDQSEIVREAIDLYYDKHTPVTETTKKKELVPHG